MKPDLTWLPNETAFNAAMGDASVHIGGKNPNTRFVPNINMGKFGDEAWVNMNAHNIHVTNEKHVVVEDKVSLTVGNETHRMYTLNNDDLEWEVEFAERPVSDDYEYKIDMSAGVKAYKQVHTQQDIDMGAQYTRPDSEGSYAFYCDKVNGKYKTGKVAHIYRPKLIDALGVEAWCDMDLQGNILTITMPTEALDTMTYPVILDPMIGYNVAGASVYNAVAGYDWAMPYTNGLIGGTIASMHAHVFGVTATLDAIKVSVHPDPVAPSGTSALLDWAELTPLATGASEISASAVLGGSVLASTDYWISWGLSVASKTGMTFDTGFSSKLLNRNTLLAYSSIPQDPYTYNTSGGLGNRYAAWVEFGIFASTLVGGGLGSDDSVMFLASGGSSEL